MNYITQMPAAVAEPKIFRRRSVEAARADLALRARVESITASSALEGIIVADPVRADHIIQGDAPVLRDRSEQEFAGYRATLDYLLAEDWRPLNMGLLLHLHKLLFERTEATGGTFKSSDNLVVDRSPDGSVEVRFVPVAASQTPYLTAELVSRFNAAISAGGNHPLLLIGLFGWIS